MGNIIANVERTDIMLSKELQKLVKKDENFDAFLSICIKHYSKGRNGDLDLATT